MLQIDKGVPLPEARYGTNAAKYPVKDMVVGDSFFVPFEEGWDEERKRKRQRGVAIALLHWKKRIGYGFTTRRVDGGVRAWRVE